MKLIAMQELWYAGKTRRPGDEFDASDSDVKILTAPDLPGGQKARKMDDVPVTSARAPVVSAVQEETSPSATEDKPKSLSDQRMDAEEPTKPARRYRRRDMVAED